MKKFFLLSTILSVVLLASCAVRQYVAPQPQNKRFTFNSEPEGAKVYYNGELVCNSTPGSAVIKTPAKTPAVASVLDAANKKLAKTNAMVFSFVKSGYKTKEVVLEPTVTVFSDAKTKTYGPIFDWANGVFCELERKQVYEDDPTIVAGAAEERVSRDNAGATSLERTIIRWYFDSEPRGARIFWRVISSVPSEVKNTNETYLTTTPYEETRGFNILGLTYENSRDVVIEIKVTKRGYEDQVKRFNVRQAIDQQEISGFFELVPKE